MHTSVTQSSEDPFCFHEKSCFLLKSVYFAYGNLDDWFTYLYVILGMLVHTLSESLVRNLQCIQTEVVQHSVEDHDTVVNRRIL